MPEVIGEAELTCEAINEAVSEPLRTTVRLEVRETRKMKLEELSEVKKSAKNMSEVRLKLEEFQKAEWKSVKTVHEDSMELEDFLEDREVRERLVSGPSLAGAVLSSKMHQAPTLPSEGRGWNSSQSFQGRGWEAGERLERSKSRQSSLPILEEEEDRRRRAEATSLADKIEREKADLQRRLAEVNSDLRAQIESETKGIEGKLLVDGEEMRSQNNALMARLEREKAALEAKLKAEAAALELKLAEDAKKVQKFCIFDWFN